MTDVPKGATANGTPNKSPTLAPSEVPTTKKAGPERDGRGRYKRKEAPTPNNEDLAESSDNSTPSTRSNSDNEESDAETFHDSSNVNQHEDVEDEVTVKNQGAGNVQSQEDGTLQDLTIEPTFQELDGGVQDGNMEQALLNQSVLTKSRNAANGSLRGVSNENSEKELQDYLKKNVHAQRAHLIEMSIQAINAMAEVDFTNKEEDQYANYFYEAINANWEMSRAISNAIFCNSSDAVIEPRIIKRYHDATRRIRRLSQRVYNQARVQRTKRLDIPYLKSIFKMAEAEFIVTLFQLEQSQAGNLLRARRDTSTDSLESYSGFNEEETLALNTLRDKHQKKMHLLAQEGGEISARYEDQTLNKQQMLAEQAEWKDRVVATRNVQLDALHAKYQDRRQRVKLTQEKELAAIALATADLGRKPGRSRSPKRAPLPLHQSTPFNQGAATDLGTPRRQTKEKPKSLASTKERLMEDAGKQFSTRPPTSAATSGKNHEKLVNNVGEAIAKRRPTKVQFGERRFNSNVGNAEEMQIGNELEELEAQIAAQADVETQQLEQIRQTQIHSENLRRRRESVAGNQSRVTPTPNVDRLEANNGEGVLAPQGDNEYNHRFSFPPPLTQRPAPFASRTPGPLERNRQLADQSNPNWGTTNQSAMISHMAPRSVEVMEDFEKSTYYGQLPEPWNVQPRTTCSERDELNKIKILLGSNNDGGSNQLRRFDGNESEYFEWRAIVIITVHRANMAAAEKFQYMTKCIQYRKDATLDAIIMGLLPTADNYAQLIGSLEAFYGGTRKAFTQVQMMTSGLRQLDPEVPEDLIRMSGVITRYYNFCVENGLSTYLDAGLVTDDLYKKVFTTKQHKLMMEKCQLSGLTAKHGRDSTHLLRAHLQSELASALHTQTQRSIQSKPVANRRLGSDAYGAAATTSSDRRPSKLKGGEKTKTTRFARNSKPRVYLTKEDSGSEPESQNEYDAENSESEGEEIRVYLLTEDMAVDEGTVLALMGTKRFQMPICNLCKGEKHFLFMCPSFKNWDLEARKKYVTSNRRCYNCLATHDLKNCTSKIKCRLCKHGHHTSLCGKGPIGPLPEYKPDLAKKSSSKVLFTKKDTKKPKKGTRPKGGSAFAAFDNPEEEKEEESDTDESAGSNEDED